MEPSGVLAPSEWSEILPPLQTFGYLAALTASAFLLLASVLTIYVAAGVRVKAWSLRVNSFVTLLFITALANPSTNLEGELLIPEDDRCTNLVRGGSDYRVLLTLSYRATRLLKLRQTLTTLNSAVSTLCQCCAE